MIRNLDIGLLRAFASVADLRSMTAAGRLLNLTQGAISQQIARLEALAGGALLARDRRGLRLTPAGERLLDRSRRLLALNDDVWAELSGGAVDGPVCLGVPHDLVGTRLAPALKAFAEAHPQAELSLVCETSAELTLKLASGALDVVVLEQPMEGATGECLAVDRLVWAGARGGSAHAKSPLPLSMVADTCIFRPTVLEVLKRERRAWRAVFENGSLDATVATVRMDLAVSAWLESTVPVDLDILGPDAGLPGLPAFAITLHVPARSTSRAASELARQIRESSNRLRDRAIPGDPTEDRPRAR